MKYVKLGSSDISVSRICFGTLTIGPVQANLPLEQGGELLAYALEKGINFVDTAQLYETYPYIRYAMEKSGKFDTVISSKTYAYTAKMAREAVEQARKELNRDYIDIFMLHEQESTYTLDGHKEALEVLFDYKEKGIIKAVGASMHHVAAVYGAIEKGLDVIHPLINYKGLGIVDGSRQNMEEAIAKASSLGIGVFSMKSMAGGNLFRQAENCFKYSINLDGVHSTAIGMQSQDEVDANLNFLEKGSFTILEKENLMSKKRKLHIDDWCVGCGLCVQRCTQKAIALNTKNMAVCQHEKCILCGYCCTGCDMWAIKIV